MKLVIEISLDTKLREVASFGAMNTASVIYRLFANEGWDVDPGGYDEMTFSIERDGNENT
jgi:hypothetical protein